MTRRNRSGRHGVAAFFAATLLLASISGTAHAIPAWARRYNMNCTGCHYPMPPVLNADGLAFKWAGYRMPDQIGKSVEVTKIGDYLAVRGIIQYALTKSSDATTDSATLYVPSASLFAAGPLGKWFGGFLELETTPDGPGVTAQAIAVFGGENSFGSVRLVSGPLISEGAVAGLDRAIGVLTPLPIDISTGSNIGFSFADHNGLDFSWIFGKKDRAAIGVANSMSPTGGAPRPRQDLFISNQYVWDLKGGGLSVVGYLGNAPGVDPNYVDATAHFYRVAATADHYFGDFNAVGGYVYGKDNNLPVGNLFTATSETGQAYWLGAGYTFPETYLTFYGRWEHVDPNTSVSNDAFTRYVIGGIAPLMTPQYLKLNLEYFHDAPQLSGAPTRQGLYVEFQMVY